MVKMWKAVVAVEDDTLETESDDEDTTAPRPAAAYPVEEGSRVEVVEAFGGDRKSTRLNSSHGYISYAVFCLKKKEHTSELLSRLHLVCRLLLEKTKQKKKQTKTQ